MKPHMLILLALAFLGQHAALRGQEPKRLWSAELKSGVLHIHLPKIEDRRGEEVIVEVKDATE